MAKILMGTDRSNDTQEESPIAQDSPHDINLAMLGASGSGKTVFWGAYFCYAQDEGEGKYTIEIKKPAVNDNIKQLKEQLFVLKTPPLGTAKIHDLSFYIPDLPPGKNIVLYDIPGGFTTDMKAWKDNIAEQLEKADGIIIFISGPDLLKPELKNTLQNYLSTFWDAIARNRDIKKTQGIKHFIPLLVLFTKSDEFSKTYTEKELLDLTGAFGKNLKKADQRRIVNVYKTTSIGDWPDTNTLPDKNQHENVIEPIEWLIQKAVNTKNKTITQAITKVRKNNFFKIGAVVFVILLLLLTNLGIKEYLWRDLGKNITHLRTQKHFQEGQKSIQNYLNNFPSFLIHYDEAQKLGKNLHVEEVNFIFDMLLSRHQSEIENLNNPLPQEKLIPLRNDILSFLNESDVPGILSPEQYREIDNRQSQLRRHEIEREFQNIVAHQKDIKNQDSSLSLEQLNSLKIQVEAFLSQSDIPVLAREQYLTVSKLQSEIEIQREHKHYQLITNAIYEVNWEHSPGKDINFYRDSIIGIQTYLEQNFNFLPEHRDQVSDTLAYFLTTVSFLEIKEIELPENQEDLQKLIYKIDANLIQLPPKASKDWIQGLAGGMHKAVIGWLELIPPIDSPELAITYSNKTDEFIKMQRMPANVVKMLNNRKEALQYRALELWKHRSDGIKAEVENLNDKEAIAKIISFLSQLLPEALVNEWQERKKLRIKNYTDGKHRECSKQEVDKVPECIQSLLNDEIVNLVPAQKQEVQYQFREAKKKYFHTLLQSLQYEVNQVSSVENLESFHQSWTKIQNILPKGYNNNLIELAEEGMKKYLDSKLDSIRIQFSERESESDWQGAIASFSSLNNLKEQIKNWENRFQQTELGFDRNIEEMQQDLEVRENALMMNALRRQKEAIDEWYQLEEMIETYKAMESSPMFNRGNAISLIEEAALIYSNTVKEKLTERKTSISSYKQWDHITEQIQNYVKKEIKKLQNAANNISDATFEEAISTLEESRKNTEDFLETEEYGELQRKYRKLVGMDSPGGNINGLVDDCRMYLNRWESSNSEHPNYVKNLNELLGTISNGVETSLIIVKAELKFLFAPDAFVKVSYNSVDRETAVSESKNPSWEKSFDIKWNPDNFAVKLSVWDKDIKYDDEIIKAQIIDSRGLYGFNKLKGSISTDDHKLFFSYKTESFSDIEKLRSELENAGW
jgi:hypothetical protein